MYRLIDLHLPGIAHCAIFIKKTSSIMHYRLLFLILILLNYPLSAQQRPALMPWPQQIQKIGAGFRLNENLQIKINGNSERLERYVARFKQRLARRTTLFFDDTALANKKEPRLIQIKFTQTPDVQLDVDESYQLLILPAKVTLTATTDIGIMRGLETLLQLLTADDKSYFFPGYEIKDKPRFVWRGLLLDVCRHWMPKEVVLRNLDALAAVKMNVLHLHLTEDQGFRIESKVYPALHELGSDGHYFTQQDIREIVAYAADRGIRVVPEFDMPGHATSWFVGYPELASAPGPYELARTFGVKDPTMDPSKPETYEFLKNFLTEMAGLFPDEFIHIGGDENNGKQWSANEDIQAFMAEKRLASNHELQAYFNRRLAAILTRLNKRLVGWDEILDERLPKSIVIQSWRGKQALVDAANAGYDVLLSNGYYIDLFQPAAYHYLNDPLPAGVPIEPQARAHVLGGEATMWAELISPETVDGRIWPRTAAIAERLWSPAAVKDVEDMYSRLRRVAVQLENVGLQHLKNYEMMMRRLVGEENVPVLRTLVDLLEPVEGYKRHGARKYTVFSPLTRVVDIARSDAFEAMDFNKLAGSYVANHDMTTKEELKALLLTWVENHKQMKTLARHYPAIAEVMPLSEDMWRLAILGLQAMSNTTVHDAEWRASAEKALNDAAMIKAECELKVVEGIRVLVEAAQ